MNKVDSPCVRKCCLNKDDICIGCLRSLDEIKEWSVSDETLKEKIMQRINHQREQLQ